LHIFILLIYRTFFKGKYEIITPFYREIVCIFAPFYREKSLKLHLFHIQQTVETKPEIPPDV